MHVNPRIIVGGSHTYHTKPQKIKSSPIKPIINPPTTPDKEDHNTKLENKKFDKMTGESETNLESKKHTHHKTNKVGKENLTHKNLNKVKKSHHTVEKDKISNISLKFNEVQKIIKNEIKEFNEQVDKIVCEEIIDLNIKSSEIEKKLAKLTSNTDKMATKGDFNDFEKIIHQLRTDLNEEKQENKKMRGNIESNSKIIESLLSEKNENAGAFQNVILKYDEQIKQLSHDTAQILKKADTSELEPKEKIILKHCQTILNNFSKTGKIESRELENLEKSNNGYNKLLLGIILGFIINYLEDKFGAVVESLISNSIFDKMINDVIDPIDSLKIVLEITSLALDEEIELQKSHPENKELLESLLEKKLALEERLFILENAINRKTIAEKVDAGIKIRGKSSLINESVEEVSLVKKQHAYRAINDEHDAIFEGYSELKENLEQLKNNRLKTEKNSGTKLRSDNLKNMKKITPRKNYQQINPFNSNAKGMENRS